MEFIADTFTILGFIAIVVLILIIAGIIIRLYFSDRNQIRHPILRNFPVIGKVRYFLERIGPELRQYLYNSDTEGKPFSRDEFEHVVKTAKYKRDVIGFGSKRDFEDEGFYVRNNMFPKLREELRIDRETKIKTKRYVLLEESFLFPRKEKYEEEESSAYLLQDEDAVVIGEKTCRYPFRAHGLVGMSAMSYGSLGDHAITTLSIGLNMAKGTWMNTGEGGLSDYHLRGGTDIIMQIGPGMFGVRDKEGNFNWEELKNKSEIEQVKAFEIKLAQGAKTRGGHLDAEKVTEEIARIRMIEPYHSVDSPNRFEQFSTPAELCDFIEKIRDVTGKPVGMKIVVGSNDSLFEFVSYMKESGKGPDFITVDGGEGGTGASYQELIDSVGLPIHSALPIVDATLRRFGIRDRVKLFASGKLFTPDRVAIALAMGADLVNVARGLMFSIGCIQALRCQSNSCPTGVATTSPELQKGLVIDEKKYRVCNYIVTLRKGLFRISAAAGIDTPTKFKSEHIIFKDQNGVVHTLDEIYEKVYDHIMNVPWPGDKDNSTIDPEYSEDPNKKS